MSPDPRSPSSSEATVLRSRPSFRGDIIEADLLGVLCSIFVIVWTFWSIFSFSHEVSFDIFLARIVSLMFLFGIGWAEFKIPRAGVLLFILIWPEMLVFRELAHTHLRPWFIMFPENWGGPLAASLGVAIWFRQKQWSAYGLNSQLNEGDENRPNPPKNFRETTAWRWTFRILFVALFLSAAQGLLHSKNPLPGWVVEPTSWKDMIQLPAYGSLRPVFLFWNLAPCILLGLIFLNPVLQKYLSPLHTNAQLKINLDLIPWSLFAISLFVAGQVIFQVGSATQGSFSLSHRWEFGEQYKNFKWAFDQGPPAGPFSNRNTTGPFLVTHGALGFALAFKMDGKARWLVLASSLIVLWAAFLTQSRNTWFMLAALPWLALFIRAGWKRLLTAFLSFALMVTTLLYAPLPKAESGSPTAFSRVTKSLHEFRSGKSQAASTGRQALWSVSWQIIRAHPLGSGLGTFPYQAHPNSAIGKQYSLGAHHSPHSMPIHLLVEAGPLALIAWLGLWIFLPWKALIFWKKNNIFALPVLLVGMGNLLDTSWLVSGFTTVSVLLIVIALLQHADVDGEETMMKET